MPLVGNQETLVTPFLFLLKAISHGVASFLLTVLSARQRFPVPMQRSRACATRQGTLRCTSLPLVALGRPAAEPAWYRKTQSRSAHLMHCTPQLPPCPLSRSITAFHGCISLTVSPVPRTATRPSAACMTRTKSPTRSSSTSCCSTTHSVASATR